MMWSNGSWSVGAWLAMWSMMALFWGAVIVLGAWLVRTRRPGQRGPVWRAGTVGADRVLAERFARGEIDEAQFTRNRTILHAHDDA